MASLKKLRSAGAAGMIALALVAGGCAASSDPGSWEEADELGKIEEKPVVRQGKVVIRSVLPLTGTFDHRIVDGMQIGKLARSIKRNFRKPGWLDEIPAQKLESCLFQPRAE